jgi:hypothetical protein
MPINELTQSNTTSYHSKPTRKIAAIDIDGYTRVLNSYSVFNRLLFVF